MQKILSVEEMVNMPSSLGTGLSAVFGAQVTTILISATHGKFKLQQQTCSSSKSNSLYRRATIQGFSESKSGPHWHRMMYSYNFAWAGKSLVSHSRVVAICLRIVGYRVGTAVRLCCTRHTIHLPTKYTIKCVCNSSMES